MGVANDYSVALSCLCAIRRMLDVPRTRIKAVRFDLSSEDNGEGDPAKVNNAFPRDAAGHCLSFIVVSNANSYSCGLKLLSSKAVMVEGLLARYINICHQGSGCSPVSSHIENWSSRQPLFYTIGQVFVRNEAFQSALILKHWLKGPSRGTGTDIYVLLWFSLMKSFELGKPISCTGKYNRF